MRGGLPLEFKLALNSKCSTGGPQTPCLSLLNAGISGVHYQAKLRNFNSVCPCLHLSIQLTLGLALSAESSCLHQSLSPARLPKELGEVPKETMRDGVWGCVCASRTHAGPSTSSVFLSLSSRFLLTLESQLKMPSTLHQMLQFLQVSPEKQNQLRCR